MSQLKETQHLKIPLKDIEVATNNFEVCIGNGGYGRVYKGELFISGKLTVVAVKRLNANFGQGLKEFLTEIQLLSGQTHPNLISLLGYCDDEEEKILVYKYAERGSLDQYIRSSDTTCALTWQESLKICVGAARGLEYLHNHVGKHQTIIHRDIKSANVLIDQNCVAKISDLGLSKLSLSGLNRSVVISQVCGTYGYCEPEYFSSGTVKKESDVYSFGMVLFEVLCRRICNVKGRDGLLFSAKLIKDYYKRNKLDEIVDPGFRKQMNSDCLKKISAIAYGCLLDDREQRPPMKRVVKELEELMIITQKQHEEENTEQNNSLSSSSPDENCRCFSLSAIKLATNDFDDAFVIGMDGFWKVYKGKIDLGEGNGIDVVVKRLDLDSKEWVAGIWAQIDTLSKGRHRNVTSLLGYYADFSKREMILVGSLGDHFHKREAQPYFASFLVTRMVIDRHEFIRRLMPGYRQSRRHQTRIGWAIYFEKAWLLFLIMKALSCTSSCTKKLWQNILKGMKCTVKERDATTMAEGDDTLEGKPWPFCRHFSILFSHLHL